LEGTNDISRTAEARVVKFCTQVGYIKSKHTDDKSPLEGAWSMSRDPLKFFDPNDISGMAKAKQSLNCAHR